MLLLVTSSGNAIGCINLGIQIDSMHADESRKKKICKWFSSTVYCPLESKFQSNFKPSLESELKVGQRVQIAGPGSAGGRRGILKGYDLLSKRWTVEIIPTQSEAMESLVRESCKLETEKLKRLATQYDKDLEILSAGYLPQHWTFYPYFAKESGTEFFGVQSGRPITAKFACNSLKPVNGHKLRFGVPTTYAQGIHWREVLTGTTLEKMKANGSPIILVPETKVSSETAFQQAFFAKCTCCSRYARVSRCSACYGAVYCSKECQKKDWISKGHKQYCKGKMEWLRPKLF